jgi:hypothetical protein
MNWKVFGRRRSLSNRGILQAYVWTPRPAQRMSWLRFEQSTSWLKKQISTQPLPDQIISSVQEYYIFLSFRANAKASILVMAKQSRNSPYCGTEQSILLDHVPPSHLATSRTTVPALLTSLSRHHIPIEISSRMHALSYRKYKNLIQPYVAGPQHDAHSFGNRKGTAWKPSTNHIQNQLRMKRRSS